MQIKTLKVLKAKYRAVGDQLMALYGFPTWRQHLPPVEELVNCILSQSTSDNNRDLGYAQLIARYPTWEAVRDAPLSELTDAIRPAGLAGQKAPRIQNALKLITEKHGTITLDFLNVMSVDDARTFLQSIPGVGPKTAAIVLLFSLNKPAFPVDRHVHRVGQRIGLIGPKVSADQAHPIFEQIVPPEEYYSAHLNIIAHGRRVCQARVPGCERCPLTALCDYYKSKKSRVEA
jgi:endonuclease-3